MIKFLIETLDFERVEFKTDILNIPARRALLRIGAKEEGILRSHTLMTHNRRRDTIYYSILKSEWNEIKIKNNWR
jgi:RimJ/RimL family protein N-acetyltransferase